MRLNADDAYILNDIARNAKTMEEYKKALEVNHIKFIEFTSNTGTIIVPQIVNNKLTKAKRNKLSKIGG